MPFDQRTAPEVIERRVLYGVEVLEPVTGVLVSEGLSVTAEDIPGAAKVSASGRFYWLEGTERARGRPVPWPSYIEIDPGKLPFKKMRVPAKVRPADMTVIKAEERLQPIRLVPTDLYLFPDGVTALRGRLMDGEGEDARPIEGAEVSLEWFDEQLEEWSDKEPVRVTGADGSFAVIILKTKEASIEFPGQLQVSVRVTRGDQTRWTDDKFVFEPDAELKIEPGRVREDKAVSKEVVVAWPRLVEMIAR